MIGESRTVIHGYRTGRSVDDILVGNFDVQIHGLIAKSDSETYRPIGATQLTKGVPAKVPVVEIAIDGQLRVDSVAIQLIANDVIALAGERKLIFVLRERIGNRARGAREHLLLAGAER